MMTYVPSTTSVWLTKMAKVYEAHIKSNEFDLNKTFPYVKEPIYYLYDFKV